MEFKVRPGTGTGCPRYSLFLGRREGWRGGGGGGAGEKKPVIVAMSFALLSWNSLGGVEAAGVSEGGGEVVGGFGEVKGGEGGRTFVEFLKRFWKLLKERRIELKEKGGGKLFLGEKD